MSYLRSYLFLYLFSYVPNAGPIEVRRRDFTGLPGGHRCRAARPLRGPRGIFGLGGWERANSAGRGSLAVSPSPRRRPAGIRGGRSWALRVASFFPSSPLLVESVEQWLRSSLACVALSQTDIASRICFPGRRVIEIVFRTGKDNSTAAG